MFVTCNVLDGAGVTSQLAGQDVPGHMLVQAVRADRVDVNLVNEWFNIRV